MGVGDWGRYAGAGECGISGRGANGRLRRCLPVLGQLLERGRLKYGVSASPRVVSYGDTVPKGGGVYRVGAPYVVAGRVYVPEDNPNYRADGLASW